jgi:hypothetical protein
MTAEHEGVWQSPETPEQDDEATPMPADEEDEALARAAKADETLAPGSMPGGPDYPAELAEPDPEAD